MNDGTNAGTQILRRMALAFMAAGFGIWAACSTGTGTESTSGGQVTARQAPAAEAPETPSDEMGGTGAATGSSGATGSTTEPMAAAGSNDAQLRAAIGAAQQWIAFVDQGQYAESWSAAGSLFQSTMQQQQWVQALTGARTPNGTVVSREVAGSELRSNLPGAPAGQYALVSFATNFQNKPDVIETVILVDEGGQWKVVGYTAAPRAAQQQGQPTPTPTPAPSPTPPQI